MITRSFLFLDPLLEHAELALQLLSVPSRTSSLQLLRLITRHRSSISGLGVRLPSASERAIQFRAGPQLGAARLGQEELLFEQGLIGRQDFNVAGQTGLVPGTGQIGGVGQATTPSCRCSRCSASFSIVISALATSR
jgi:hypothetical protein